jgi:serine/threonine protein kinase
LKISKLGQYYSYPEKLSIFFSNMLNMGVLIVDEARARRMTEELVGKRIGCWDLIKYIDCGKSALVFKGDYSGTESAIKIFDPELIERFGKETQLKRIQRELSLKGNDHENLVQILDGGECSSTGHFFVAMSYLPMPSLKSALPSIPRSQIRCIISQIAGAAQHLELLGLCHRDIKPANIAISADFDKSILLDLGVLRPIGISDLTDERSRPFIGTLRYSSPEFLMRMEKDTIEGWRAVTFYQLGALLHDLIMKKPLFDEYSEPYAKLVDAVKYINPEIKAEDVSPDLIHLAQTCLIKDPELRVRLVQWERFSGSETAAKSISSIQERIRDRCIAASSGLTVVDSPTIVMEREARQQSQIQMQVFETIETLIRTECIGNHLFPPMKICKIDDRIEITFPPSSSCHLQVFLRIIFVIEILELSNKAILITYLSCLIKEDVCCNIRNEDYTSIFRGVYQKETLEDRIMNILYLSLDAAQQCGEDVKEAFQILSPFQDDDGGLAK